MQSHVVLTLSGKDRVGIVEQITQQLLQVRGNVEASQMARLGGEFAVLMLIELPTEQLPGLQQLADQLAKQGFKVTTSETVSPQTPSYSGWFPFKIEVVGADHQGIIHEVAQSLAKQGISVEWMETGIDAAPVSGTPLFTMNAEIMVPPTVDKKIWQPALEDVGRKLNVDISISTV